MTLRLLPLLLIVACIQQGPEDYGQEPKGTVQGTSLLQGAEPQGALPATASDPAGTPREPQGDGSGDPGTGEARSITFAHLSMAGADVNGLIDLMFAEEPDGAEFDFPEPVQELNGEEISIVGYMIALDFEGEAVTHFMLVRDLAACCFGGIPRPDEWIDVHVAEPCPYWVYRPVRVTGKLSVGLEQQEEAFMTSVLQIKGAAASMEE